MNQPLPDAYQLSPPVARALSRKLPVVALESTVITHGLPHPENLELARMMENRVREKDAQPATIAVLQGRVHIGLEDDQLERLVQETELHKISVRDIAPALAKKWSGGTTVAGTLIAAHAAGIKVFATGGIGGVHRRPGGEAAADVSADLPQLAKTPLVVVCAGAKAILDLPATVEYLETFSIPVVGYRTSEFPAFYSRTSGLETSARADTPAEVAEIARQHWALGQSSAILVVNPPPEEVALPPERIQTEIEQALQDAEEQGLRGQAVTPFLLERVSQLSRGASLQANLGLLLHNAALAAEIALEFSRGERFVRL
jgi:pseudouridine-5'-phosphate glycosidase